MPPEENEPTWFLRQEWPDKLSDKALARFCLYGIGAHRVDIEVQNGQKLFVACHHFSRHFEVAISMAKTRCKALCNHKIER